MKLHAPILLLIAESIQLMRILQERDYEYPVFDISINGKVELPNGYYFLPTISLFVGTNSHASHPYTKQRFILKTAIRETSIFTKDLVCDKQNYCLADPDYEGSMKTYGFGFISVPILLINNIESYGFTEFTSSQYFRIKHIMTNDQKNYYREEVGNLGLSPDSTFFAKIEELFEPPLSGFFSILFTFGDQTQMTSDMIFSRDTDIPLPKLRLVYDYDFLDGGSTVLWSAVNTHGINSFNEEVSCWSFKDRAELSFEIGSNNISSFFIASIVLEENHVFLMPQETINKILIPICSAVIDFNKCSNPNIGLYDLPLIKLILGVDSIDKQQITILNPDQYAYIEDGLIRLLISPNPYCTDFVLGRFFFQKYDFGFAKASNKSEYKIVTRPRKGVEEYSRSLLFVILSLFGVLFCIGFCIGFIFFGNASLELFRAPKPLKHNPDECKYDDSKNDNAQNKQQDNESTKYYQGSDQSSFNESNVHLDEEKRFSY